MATHYVEVAPGKTETVNADRVEEDVEAGVRHLVRNGEIVRSVPAGTRIRVIEVTEDLHPRSGWPPAR